MKIKKRWYALFTAPLMITFFVVVIIPFFIGIGYSFNGFRHDYKRGLKVENASC